MSVDYYSCGNCTGVYCDVGDYYICSRCDQGFCTDCGDNVLVAKYGVWDENNENDYDDLDNLCGESGQLKLCPMCDVGVIDYETLAKWLALKLGKSEDELWEQHKESVIDK